MYCLFDLSRNKPGFPIYNFLLILVKAVLQFPTMFRNLIIFDLKVFNRSVLIRSQFQLTFEFSKVHCLKIIAVNFIRIFVFVQ